MKCYKKVLNFDFTKFLKNCSKIRGRYSFEFDTIDCNVDHIHLFVEAEPKNSPSGMLATLKGITARKIFKEYSKVIKQLRRGELRSDIKYIEKLRDGTTFDIIENYVQNQGNNHSQLFN